jgi:hypothetical protein
LSALGTLSAAIGALFIDKLRPTVSPPHLELRIGRMTLQIGWRHEGANWHSATILARLSDVHRGICRLGLLGEATWTAGIVALCRESRRQPQWVERHALRHQATKVVRRSDRGRSGRRHGSRYLSPVSAMIGDETAVQCRLSSRGETTRTTRSGDRDRDACRLRMRCQATRDGNHVAAVFVV